MYSDNLYLYLTLDPSLDVKLPFAWKRKAFCSGFIAGMYHANETELDLTSLEPGGIEQINAIVSHVSGISEDNFDPYSKNQRLAENIRYNYGSCMEGACDDSPPASSPYQIQRACITGYRAALNFKGVSDEQPIGFYATVYETTEEAVAETRKMAIELLNTLLEED